MPVYEFQCEFCESVEEHIMRLSDENPVTCGQCDKDGLKKIISRPADLDRIKTDRQEVMEKIQRGEAPQQSNLWSAPAPWNAFKDGDDHYEERDPNDPKTLEKRKKETKKKIKNHKEMDKVMNETYRKWAAGED